MYKRALVPLDGSPFAEMVLPFLREIAGPLDLEVILLRVVTPEPEPVLDAPPRTLLREPDARQVDAQEYLAPLAGEREAPSRVPI